MKKKELEHFAEEYNGIHIMVMVMVMVNIYHYVN